MVFHKVLWWCPQLDDEFKEYERQIQFQHSQGHGIYVQNQTQSFAFEHHFLLISIVDLNLIFYIRVFNIKKKVIMKRNTI